MHLRFPLILIGIMLCTTITAGQAEIIRRVNPDGSITEYVPQKVPAAPRAEPQPGPCDQPPSTPNNYWWAKDAFQASLQRLRSAPNDPQCRAQALQLGRLYSQFSRTTTIGALYDETTLMNDINVITGSGTK